MQAAQLKGCLVRNHLETVLYQKPLYTGSNLPSTAGDKHWHQAVRGASEQVDHYRLRALG